MAWRAFLESVSDPSAPGDSVNANVRYTESVSGKTFVKGYSLQAVNFKQLQAFKDLILGELQGLADFDVAATGIKTFVGREIK